MHTTDAGITWSTLHHPSRLTLRAVHAAAADQAWIAGDSGLILHYRTTDPPGCWATPTPAPAPTGAPPADGTVQRQVAHCVDDAYSVAGANVELRYARAEVRMGGRLGVTAPYFGHWDGFLFRDVGIPRGAQITSARLRLAPTNNQSGSPVIVEIAGEMNPQADDFSPQNAWPQTPPAHGRARQLDHQQQGHAADRLPGHRRHRPGDRRAWRLAAWRQPGDPDRPAHFGHPVPGLVRL